MDLLYNTNIKKIILFIIVISIIMLITFLKSSKSCNCGKEQIDFSEINLSDSESGDE